MAHKKGELLLVKLALELQLIRRADSKSNSPFLCAWGIVFIVRGFSSSYKEEITIFNVKSYFHDKDQFCPSLIFVDPMNSYWKNKKVQNLKYKKYSKNIEIKLYNTSLNILTPQSQND